MRIAMVGAAMLGVWMIGAAPAAAGRGPALYVQGRLVDADAIVVGGGHVLVPVRGVFEALGADVRYVAPHVVVVRKGDDVIAGLVIGRRTAIVANQARNVAVPPVRIGGRVYVPLRAIAEFAGARVTYAMNIIDIRMPQAPALASTEPAAAVAPDDPALPPYTYVVVAGLVLLFAAELARQILRNPEPRAPRALGVLRGAREFADSVASRHDHEVRESAKEPRIDDAVNRA